MKNLYTRVKINISIMAMLFAFTSCHDKLFQEPISDAVSSTFYSSEKEIEAAVYGVYATLQRKGSYSLYIPAIGEVSSDNSWEEVPNNDGGIYGELDDFSVVPTNGMISSIWKDSYVGIQRSNLILNRISDISFESEETKKARMGEMKFIRSLLYFNLVRLFGDVPLVLEETVDPFNSFGVKRTPVAEVYAQIEKDLTEAIADLPVDKDAVRVSKGAAQALLGKVYLTKKEYAKAKTQLEAVVNSKTYSLVSDLDKIFGEENENNSEYIFAVQFSSGLDGDSEGSNAFQQFAPADSEISGAKGHNLPTNELLALYVGGDNRLTEYFIDSLTLEAKDKSDSIIAITPYTNKLSENTSKAEDGGSDWIVLRYSDIVLMLAEAELENGSVSTSTLALYNEIRTRAGLSIETTLTADKIALERRLELALEGHRWFDLLRTGKAIEVMSHTKTIVENDLLMPIPANQLDTDPALTQNPGYN